MGELPPTDLDSFVLNSTYRRIVVEHLATSGEATPQQIADQSDAKRPHISRALAELRERDAVELRVSEHTTVGRYYGLTPAGETAWERTKESIRDVDWSVSEPYDESSEAVVELARDEFGGALRFVGERRNDEITVLFADEDCLESYTDEEVERTLRRLVF